MTGSHLFPRLLVAAICLPLAAQDRVLDSTTETRFPQPRRMLRSYLTGVAMEQLARRKQDVAAIRTKQQFEERRAEFRKKLLAMVGGLPAERTPLHVRRTGTLDRGDYRVEKIIFESQPRFYVTASLYVPQTGKAPYPAVLHPPGHSLSAKNRAFYQTLSIGLAKHGFVVLTYDPLGQGERRVFYDLDLQDSKVGGPTTEHEMLGIQSLLAGESIARLMIWDGIRGIDLLQSLPEVDPQRIGVTGCSGGGTLTTYLAAIDERIRVAAPACYISSWEDQLQVDTGPQDAEQQFPNLLSNGYDHADFVTAFAPKPYLICSTDQDFFPVSGARKTFEEGQRIYALLGAKDNIAWFREPGGHGMPVATREAVYGWMKQWLQGAARGPAPEPKFQVEFEEDLNCTPTGQLATSLGGETASSLNLPRFARIASSSSPAQDLRRHLVDLTRFQSPPGSPQVHELGKSSRGAYSLERLVCELSAGRYVPALLALPDGAPPRKQPILYAGDTSAAAAFAPGGDLDRLASSGSPILAIDVSGRGETASTWRSYSEQWFSSQEKEAWLALMVGRTLTGLHVEEIVAALELLDRRGLLADGPAIGFGKGLSAVDLLHAAVVDSRIGSLILEEMLVSYAAVARSPIHRQIFEVVIPGVLARYDLPDLVASLAPRPVVLVNARTPVGKPMPSAAIRQAYQAATDNYRAKGQPGSLRIGLRRETDSVLDAYPELR